MDQQNMQFLMRHLALAELIGGRIEEFDGGCKLFGSEVWIALWHPERVDDYEQLINETIDEASEHAQQMAGVLLLTPPATANREAVKELEETCFLMGYPRTQGLNRGGPDVVQILKKPPAAPPGITVSMIPANSDAVVRISEELGASDDRTDSPIWVDDEILISRMEAFLASRDGEEAGLLCLISSEVVGRICVLWVSPENRETGAGQALVAAAADHLISRGRLLTCTWTHREGRLRYFFNKMGFEDSLSAVYFMNQESI